MADFPIIAVINGLQHPYYRKKAPSLLMRGQCFLSVIISALMFIILLLFKIHERMCF